jgi:glycosyltransferase involved in cell wall biosynthesis
VTDRALRLSIVTPNLNQAEFLNETLSSVVDQGYPELEYVVVDGGSSDGSVGIIETHAAAIASWVSEPDSGHANAINKGFARTTGEVMGWLNCTDLYYPWTLQTVSDIFRDLPEVEWIQGVPTSVDIGRDPKFVAPGRCNRYDLLLDSIPRIQQESVFWRRSLWERAGGALDETARLACDYELWLRFSRHAPLYHAGTILAAFRYHDDGRGKILRRDYDRELERIKAVELERSPVQERRRLRLLQAVRRAGGRGALALVERSRLLDWYRYPRVVYDFGRRRWEVR